MNRVSTCSNSKFVIHVTFFKPQTEAEKKKTRGRSSVVKDTAGSIEAGSAVSAETSEVVLDNTAADAESAVKVNLINC